MVNVGYNNVFRDCLQIILGLHCHGRSSDMPLELFAVVTVPSILEKG